MPFVGHNLTSKKMCDYYVRCLEQKLVDLSSTGECTAEECWNHLVLCHLLKSVLYCMVVLYIGIVKVWGFLPKNRSYKSAKYLLCDSMVDSIG